ncbi:ATP-dependent helicase HrpB [Paenibacillus thermotolerans]|uniref:ATP-dependent helicase HrpB n=1 Tax=Paenibacillus thermotolerans TaxID=3027807 RepID=UPI002368EDA1|nr:MULTISPECIES: ATP-dependent helicase HrpB [unclassified Paenibacillus]
MSRTALPIETAIPALKVALRTHANAVLTAAPGAGKTTRVPLALLDEPWLQGKKIVMLEPRRLAARMAARYMAASIGEAAGERVGYRVRLDTKVSARTKIEVVTEGVLTRMIQTDPALENVGLLIFDEFHERNIHADVSLAFGLQAQSLLREDLRILVMSATLNARPVAELLGDAPIIASEGRQFPVETRYAVRQQSRDRIEDRVARAVTDALAAHAEGDVLVFLPGTGEIRRTEERLREACRSLPVHIAPLHGGLTPEEQDRAVSPAEGGKRKVVLATSIAESSLTVEGVRIVVDSGLMRVPKFSPRTGMTRLETVPVSRASADQRRGRAGRLGPGVCYRLWTEQEETLLPAQGTPEIAESDLAPLALQLAAWGVADPGELRWLDPPPAAAFAQARELLQRLGALDAAEALTPLGRRMAELPLHPRLSGMVLRAMPIGLGAAACELAALLGERDILRGGGAGQPDADVRLRLRALRAATRSAGLEPNEAAVRRVRLEAQQLQRECGAAGAGGERDADMAGVLLSFAYPDRIAARRPNGKYLLSGGRGAAFGPDQPLSQLPYVVAAELDDAGTDGRIALAAPITMEQLEEHHVDRIVERQELSWDRQTQSVRARKRKCLDALVLSEAPLPHPDPELTAAALLDGIVQEGLQILPWTKQAKQLQERIVFLHRIDSDWPDASDEALTASLTDWLAPYIGGMKSRADLQRLNVTEALLSLLPWEQRRMLDDWAPTHITVPSGSRIPIDYSDPASPSLSVRLQEVFGLQQTPLIAGGRVPIVMHLLSPAQRPVQVTRDLSSFWRDAYFEVKKDLKGRYPKHYWPDDPNVAQATNRVKPRT